MDAGAWSCGMVVGLIHDIPTVAELIERIMADAGRLIRNRLVGLFGHDEVPAMKWHEPYRRDQADAIVGHGPFGGVLSGRGEFDK
jgi:hypothetical protein